jgi:hypothetical protein
MGEKRPSWAFLRKKFKHPQKIRNKQSVNHVRFFSVAFSVTNQTS